MAESHSEAAEKIWLDVCYIDKEDQEDAMVSMESAVQKASCSMGSSAENESR